MGRKKAFRYEAIHDFENGLSVGRAKALKGRWSTDFFDRNLPLTLELACGKGAYALGLAKLFPDRNFIGIDIKADRLYLGVKRAFERGWAGRVAFIRGPIDFLTDYFASGEVAEIWITFPDPQAREREIKKRLTAPAFLQRYRDILVPNGVVHVKTDTQLFYQYTLEILAHEKAFVLENHLDIAEIRKTRPALDITTDYERIHLEQGRTIKYVKFRL